MAAGAVTVDEAARGRRRGRCPSVMVLSHSYRLDGDRAGVGGGPGPGQARGTMGGRPTPLYEQEVRSENL